MAFNADAWLLQPLTSDRPALDTALASIQPARQTCLVCGGDAGGRRLTKAAGVLVYTIGLGPALEFQALEQIASEPAQFYRAPDAEQLAEIYRQIAVEIPCPEREFWPRAREMVAGATAAP